MATLIPSFNSCKPRMTGGERRFAERLEAKLEDDYLLWYDVPVGPKYQHPDFIVLHPRHGLLSIRIMWRDMAEVYRLRFMGEEVTSRLRKAACGWTGFRREKTPPQFRLKSTALRL